MGYYIYGKRTKPIRYYSPLGSRIEGPDSMFRALDKNGVRVNSLSKAKMYETRAQAQEVLNANRRPKEDGILLEIRKSS